MNLTNLEKVLRTAEELENEYNMQGIKASKIAILSDALIKNTARMGDDAVEGSILLAKTHLEKRPNQNDEEIIALWAEKITM